MKKTNYFSHDSNARNDSKIISLRMKLGVEGYGIYFMIIERLREETDYTCPKDYASLAFDFRTTQEKVKSVVEDFELFGFTQDGYIYSESLKQRMLIKDEKSKKHSLGGKKAMMNRYNSQVDDLTNLNENDNLLIPYLSKDDNKLSKGKESKEKERKESVIGKHTIGNSDFEDVEILEPEEKTDNFSEKLSIFQKEFSQSKRFEEIGMVFSKSKNQLENLLQEFLQENIKSRRLDKYINQQALFDELKKYFYSWVNCRENKEQDKPKSENAKRADRCLQRMSYGKS